MSATRSSTGSIPGDCKMSSTRAYQDDSIKRFSVLLAEMSARCTTKAQLRGVHRLTCTFLDFLSQLECVDAELNSGDNAAPLSCLKMEDLSSSGAGSEYCKQWCCARSCYCARRGLSSGKARDDSGKSQTLLGEVQDIQAAAPLTRVHTRYPSPSKMRSAPAAFYRPPTPYVSPASSYCALSMPTTPDNYDAFSSSTDTGLTTDSSSNSEVWSDDAN